MWPVAIFSLFVPVGTHAHLADDFNHRLGVQIAWRCRTPPSDRVRRIEHRLRAALAVAQIDEEDAAEVAARVDPAGQGDSLPGVFRAELIAMVRAFHVEQAGESGGSGPCFKADSCAETVTERIRLLASTVVWLSTLPHPGPLPLGEGAAASASGASFVSSWMSLNVAQDGVTSPPLPAGEGRGEGESSHLPSSQKPTVMHERSHPPAPARRPVEHHDQRDERQQR